MKCGIAVLERVWEDVNSVGGAGRHQNVGVRAGQQAVYTAAAHGRFAQRLASQVGLDTQPEIGKSLQ